MKVKDLYTSVCLAIYMLLATTACQQEKEGFLPETENTASLSLHFNLTSPLISRSVGEETTQLYYEFKDGKLNPCEAPVSLPVTTKAGDGNTVDGGGMADLTVFLVDQADNIVAKKSFSDLANVTTQTINFLNLESGEYTLYAYANTEGNDWFSLPSESENSFTSYKDALLKPLSGAVPTVQNNRMPLTAKQKITVVNGNNSRTVSMLRPVGKLSLTLINEKVADAVTTTKFSLGDALSHTGYVFKHDEILEKGTDNPYYPMGNENSYTIFPSSSQLIYETLLYETVVEGGLHFSMSYKGDADFDFQESLFDALNKIDGNDKFVIKIKDKDLFLRLEKISNNNYQIGVVSAIDLDDQCYWSLSSAGNQKRGLKNSFYNVFLVMGNNGSISFSNADSNSNRYKYGGGADYTIVGEGSIQLTYSTVTGEFTTSSNGTPLQFFEQVNVTGGEDIIIGPSPVLVQDVLNNTEIPLTTIYRNQHIQLNIIFR